MDFGDCHIGQEYDYELAFKNVSAEAIELDLATGVPPEIAFHIRQRNPLNLENEGPFDVLEQGSCNI